MKMKEDSWTLGKLDNEAYNRHVEQKESKDKQRRHSGQDEPTKVEDYKLRHQEKRSKYQQNTEHQKKPQQQQQQSAHIRGLNERQQKNDYLLNGRLQPVDQVKCGGDNVAPRGTNKDKGVSADIEELKTPDERLLKTRALQEHANADQRPAQASGQMQAKTKQSKRVDKDVNLSFCGCGFLGIYHVGVASCFHEYAPQLSMHKISGSSAGALVAMAHICGNLQLAYCTTDILAVAIEARSHTLGPFHPSFDIQASVREALERGLPEDAWQKATGKLHVSLTRVEDGENVIINEFKSNEDLIQVLLCSCFIPFWSGIRLPKFRGITYIDGGFSDNLLTLDDKTVTVSPFVGEADICPQDDTLNLLQINLSNTSFSISPSNLYRLSHALLPPEPEVLSDLCKQGFADGIRYLQKMNLISCTKCLEIRSSLLVTTDGEDMEEVLSINHNDSIGDFNKNCSAPGETSSHHIILEQQEQMIEITESRRRSSFVSTQPGPVHPPQSCSITPSISLRDLLNGKLEDDEAFVREEDALCNECNLIRQKALCDPLPKQFSDRIRDACDKVNKSLSNWIYSHRPVKYLSYLMVPYYLPIDLTMALVYRFWKKLPWIRSEMTDFMSHVLDALIVFLRRMQSRSTSAMLMGFGASWEEDVIAYEKELLKQQQEKTQVYHHHHHHHHHHHSSNISLAAPVASQGVSGAASLPTAVAGLAPNSLDGTSLTRQRASGKLSTSSPSLHHGSNNGSSQPRELHSLEDTFDSIVDVTSEQEGRIFAYYFRDSKDRLRVTEIFDLERSSNGSYHSVGSGGSGGAIAVPNQSTNQPSKAQKVFLNER